MLTVDELRNGAHHCQLRTGAAAQRTLAPAYCLARLLHAPIRNLWRSTAGQEALGPEAYSSMSYYEKYAIWDWEKSRGGRGQSTPHTPRLLCGTHVAGKFRGNA